MYASETQARRAFHKLNDYSKRTTRRKKNNGTQRVVKNMLEWNRANANRKHVRAFSLLIQFLRGICNICGKIYSFKTGNSFERLENFMVFLFIFRPEFLSEQKNRI